MSTVYILKLINDKYYVGITNKSVQERFNEHINGRGSEWTKKYKPIEIVESIKNADPFDEDKYTKKYMSQYGIDNVRGGSYTTIELFDYQIMSLEKELCTIQNKCFKCFQYGHYAKYCREIKIGTPTNSTVDQTQNILTDPNIDTPNNNNNQITSVSIDPNIDAPNTDHITVTRYISNDENKPVIINQINNPETDHVIRYISNNDKPDIIDQINNPETNNNTKYIFDNNDELVVIDPINNQETNNNTYFINKTRPNYYNRKKLKTKGECFRCGYRSHWEKDCFAKIHINGKAIKI